MLICVLSFSLRCSRLRPKCTKITSRAKSLNQYLFNVSESFTGDQSKSQINEIWSLARIDSCTYNVSGFISASIGTGTGVTRLPDRDENA